RYKGATVLAATGALRAGSDLVLSLGDREVEMALGSLLPEAISLSIPEPNGSVSYGESLIQEAQKWSSKAGCCLIGPGFDRSKEKSEALSLFWRYWKGPVLVDADGLYALSLLDRSVIKKRPDSVITPHEGEAARLLNIPVEAGRSSRLAAARELGSMWGVCVLKGALSIIDDGKSTAIVEEGHPCLSIPGSGDILSGIISSFLAEGSKPFDAACIGTWIHARSGSLLGSGCKYDGLIAREIADMVPEIIRELRNGCTYERKEKYNNE
nr:NAD(P)H-hydrate dehydratase [Synergistales bacterium]